MNIQSYMSMLTNANIIKIKNILSNVTNTDEFEIMFNNYRSDNKLSIVKFINVLKYLKLRSVKEDLKITNEVMLDVLFDYEMNSKYRVSISGIKNINNFLNLVHQRTNHIIFSILLTQKDFITNENFKYIKKISDVKSLYDIDQFDIRVRKSSEIPLSEDDMKSILNLNLNSQSKIFYRFKNRISLTLVDNKNETLLVDLTTIQSNSNPNEIYTSTKTYELELDYSLKGKKEGTVAIPDKIIKEIEIIKKVLEGTNNIISKTDSNLVIEAYKKLVFINISYQNTADNNLYTMQPIAAEVQHIIDKIPNNYSVSDKADGDKYVLFVFNKIIYLISTNMNVIKTSYTSDLNNTILEGELMYISSQKKYLYMIWDCLFYNNEDIRIETNLSKRLQNANNACENIGTKIYKSKNVNNNVDINSQEKYYDNEIKSYYKHINKLLTQDEEIIFHPKLFIFPTGADNSEVFLYSYLFWNNLMNSTICPYKLDGIIYTGIEQKYTKDKKDHQYPIFKYKPPQTNSLDVYITFAKDENTGEYIDIYDNTISDIKDSTPYRVVNIFVGDSIGTKEIPVLFMKEELNHQAFFPLVRGAVRDVDGNLIQDSTVVEMIYTNDILMPHQYRWVILKTRWDKTESVMTKQKKYGNFKDVAINVWKSMREAVTIDEIRNLSKPSTYQNQHKLLATRLNSLIISSDRQQDIYYQKQTNLGNKLRDYHNFLKSIIIYTYCAPKKEYKNGKEQQSSVLDIGCGRGGDLQKFYHPRVGNYVGIDIDFNGLFTITDNAMQRYNTFKKKYPGFPKMTFIHASGSALLDGDSQEKKIPNMTKQNKLLIENTFTKDKKYDIITSMFAIHYLFDTDDSVNNLISNINNFLKVGGYVLLTLFDPEMVMEKLQGKDTYTSYYTDEDGKKNKFYEIINNSKEPLKDKVGESIDVHMSWFMEDNKYETEYLVTPKLLNETMKKANCRLVDTDLFKNLYYMNQPFFQEVIEYEENPKNFKLYKRWAEYYVNLTGINKESRDFTFLNRYYIYQKMN